MSYIGLLFYGEQMKTLLLSLLFFSALLANEPTHFFVKYQVFSQGTQFTLHTQDKVQFGQVTKEESTYTLTNMLGHVIGTADYLDTGGREQLNIRDSKNKMRCTVYRTTHYLYPPTFQIYGIKERLIAKGGMNWVGSRLLLNDPSNGHIQLAVLKRPFFKIPGVGDYWHAETFQKEILHPIMLYFLTVMQTELDLSNLDVLP